MPSAWVNGSPLSLGKFLTAACDATASKLHLTRRRQRRFRLVKNKNALAVAPLLEETQETFAMRMRQKIRWHPAEFKRRGIEIACHGKEAFCSKEPAIGDLRQPRSAQRFGKLAAHGFMSA